MVVQVNSEWWWEKVTPASRSSKEGDVVSDWHGSAKPAGLPGKGHPGTGPGGNLSTLVKPVPPERVAGLLVCD